MFLDIDGTLLELASTPDSVVVPDTLVPSLVRTTDYLGGALALISGRPLAQIDALMAPMVFPCAGEHGAVVRLPDGTVEMADQEKSVPQIWRDEIYEAAKGWNGVLVEPKKYGIAVHFRQAPHREDDVRRLLQGIITRSIADFEILPAAMAFELRCRSLTKGRSVLRLMEVEPFFGRLPIFIGDDVTDHDGFRAVERLGGTALDVHQSFNGKPSDVLRWLEISVP